MYPLLSEIFKPKLSNRVSSHCALKANLGGHLNRQNLITMPGSLWGGQVIKGLKITLEGE